MNVLLTGANKGVGLALCKQLLDDGHRVWGCCRDTTCDSITDVKKKNPDSLHIIKMDVSDEDSVKEAYSQIMKDDPNLQFDIIYNNAGIATGGKDEKTMYDWTWKNFCQNLKINTFGPVLVSRTFLPMLKAPGGKLVAMSTSVSSIEDNDSGRLYSYRCSKTALNMAWKNLSIELKDKDINVFLTHPGSVKTEMNQSGKLSPEESAKQLLEIVYHGTKERLYGKLVSHDKSIIAW